MRPVVAIGGMSPAVEVFAPLARGAVALHCLDPIVYATESPSGDLLQAELAQLRQAAAECGEAVELVGYSAGASLALLYALAEPQRIARLHLLEPPWAGQAQIAAEADLLTTLDGCFAQARAADFLSHFVLALMAPGQYPQSAAPESADWHWQRPPRAAPLWAALRAMPLSDEVLRGLPMPVVLHTAGRSHPGFAVISGRLASRLPNAIQHHWPQADHFDLPEFVLPALTQLLRQPSAARR